MGILILKRLLLLLLLRQQELPHVAYFELAKKEGQIKPAELAAQFILFLLQETDTLEFSRQEWKLNDRAHWERWHPDVKN